MNDNATPTPTPQWEKTKQSLLEDLPKAIDKIKENYSKVYDKFNNQNAAPSLKEATILFRVLDEKKENVAKVGFNGDIDTIQKLKTDLSDKNQKKITINKEDVLKKIKSLYINRRGIENYSEGHADDEIMLNSEENQKRVLKSISFIKKVKDKNIKSDDKLIVIKYEEDGKDQEVIIDKENNFLATHDNCGLYWHSKDFKKGGTGFDDDEERVYVESKLNCRGEASLHNIFVINNKITLIDKDNKITSIDEDKIKRIIKHLNTNKEKYGISEIYGDGVILEGNDVIYYNEKVANWSEDINKKITEFQKKYTKETDNSKKFELFKNFTENIISTNNDNENDKNNLVEINILRSKASKELLKLTELIEIDDNCYNKPKLKSKSYEKIKETIDEVLTFHNGITEDLMKKEITNGLSEGVNENDVIIIKEEQKDDGYNWFSRPFSKRSTESQILFCLSNVLAFIPLIINLIYKMSCCNKDATTTLEDIKENKKRSK